MIAYLGRLQALKAAAEAPSIVHTYARMHAWVLGASDEAHYPTIAQHLPIFVAFPTQENLRSSLSAILDHKRLASSISSS